MDPILKEHPKVLQQRKESQPPKAKPKRGTQGEPETSKETRPSGTASRAAPSSCPKEQLVGEVLEQKGDPSQRTPPAGRPPKGEERLAGLHKQQYHKQGQAKRKKK